MTIFLNIDARYGGMETANTGDYLKLNPEGTFERRADGIYETVNDRAVRIAVPAAVLDGRPIEFDVLVNLMDDDLREQLHADLAPCTEQEFLDAYCKAHYKHFGTPFTVN